MTYDKYAHTQIRKILHFPEFSRQSRVIDAKHSTVRRSFPAARSDDSGGWKNAWVECQYELKIMCVISEMCANCFVPIPVSFKTRENSEKVCENWGKSRLKTVASRSCLYVIFFESVEFLDCFCIFIKE